MLEIFSGLVTGFFNNLINDIRDSIGGSVETYLLSTHDLSTLAPRPLTEEPALQAMFHLTLAMADLLLVLIFTWAFLRSQWERGFRAHYTLKVMLPRAMAAIAMAHFALLFGQMAIDLNNAMVHTVWTQPLPGGAPRLPWTFALTNGFGLPLFEIAIRLAIALMLAHTQDAEGGALRVADHGETAAWKVRGTEIDLTAELGRLLGGGVGIGDAEVHQPERRDV